MKKKPIRPAVAAAIFLLIYLLILILGASAMNAYPYYFRQKHFFSGVGDIIAAEYLNGSTEYMDASAESGLHIYLFSTDGKLIHYVSPTYVKEGTKSIDVHSRFFPVVLTGRSIYRLVIADERPRAIPDIMAVYGTPVWEHGTVVGMVFFVKNLVDLPSSLLGYFIYVSVFYWLTVFFFVSTSRKKAKLNALQQNYISNVTHALKTPISSIRALTEILCDGMETDPDQQKIYYGMILKETSRQEHMVRDVLELSKLQSNGMDFTKTKLSAAEVLSPVLDKYDSLCDCMGIEFHVSEALYTLPPLFSNAACLKQLMEILLDNALKFIPRDGCIEVCVSVSKNRAILCVRDNGIGIAPDDLPHVFDRFFKVDHDFNTKGNGLGLAIAKEIADGLNERIQAASKPGEGSAFSFTVQLKQTRE